MVSIPSPGNALPTIGAVTQVSTKGRAELPLGLLNCVQHFVVLLKESRVSAVV